MSSGCVPGSHGNLSHSTEREKKNAVIFQASAVDGCFIVMFVFLHLFPLYCDCFTCVINAIKAKRSTKKTLIVEWGS